MTSRKPHLLPIEPNIFGSFQSSGIHRIEQQKNSRDRKLRRELNINSTKDEFEKNPKKITE